MKVMINLVSAFFLVLLCAPPSSAQSACVTYNWSQPEGGGWGRFENSCGYDVVIKFRFSNGQSGMAGPLTNNEVENYYHGDAVEWKGSFCNWSESACIPSSIQEGDYSESRQENIEAVAWRMHAEAINAIRAVYQCEETLGPANCQDLFDQHLALLSELADYQNEHNLLQLDLSAHWGMDLDEMENAPDLDAVNENKSARECFVEIEDQGLGNLKNVCGRLVYCQYSDRRLNGSGRIIWNPMYATGVSSSFYSNNFRLDTCTFENRLGEN